LPQTISYDAGTRNKYKSPHEPYMLWNKRRKQIKKYVYTVAIQIYVSYAHNNTSYIGEGKRKEQFAWLI
jgi:hypothetical protein